MPKLTTKARNKLPKSSFGEPASRKFPMPDKAHAKVAKSRATQMQKSGKISDGAKQKINAKANRILRKGVTKAKAKS